MPDISMCSNEKCQLRENCYRFKATPYKLQSYFVNMAPIEENDKVSCEYQIPLTKEEPDEVHKT